VLQSPPTRTNISVRVAKSAVLGFPQVEHLFKTGGLCIMSGAYPSGTLLLTETLREREQSLGSSYPVGGASPIGETHVT
jgi:hypothetical protein